MKGVFISATDTNVGKTFLSTALLRSFQLKPLPARYWKPVQTGTLESDDTDTVKSASGIKDPCVFEQPLYRFKAPLSPHLAAEDEQASISPDKLIERAQKVLSHTSFTIVEGAGGLLVPLTDQFLLIDLVKATGLPVLLVCPDRLGVINHSLLSIEACKKRQIPLAGFVMNFSRPGSRNAGTIERIGGARCLKQIPALEILPDLSDLCATLWEGASSSLFP